MSEGELCPVCQRRHGDFDQSSYQPPEIETNVVMLSGEDIRQYGMDLYNQLCVEGYSNGSAAEVAEIAVCLHTIEVESGEVTRW